MRHFLVILCLVGMAALSPNGPARAAAINDFHAAVEQASAHGRVAAAYLRNENLDLADIELERMTEAWQQVVTRFGGARPAPFTDAARFTVVMTDVSTRLVTATILLKAGRPADARGSLLAIRDELSQLRRAANVTVLADCILDANAAMDALYAFDSKPPDWNDATQSKDLDDKSQRYADTLKRCDAMAPEKVRKDAQFRRLIDGADKSLRFVPAAIEMRDGALLHRVLIELRSLDNLLAFGFG